MFNNFLGCFSLRQGAIIIAVIFWMELIYVCWAIGTGRDYIRELRLLWNSFGWNSRILLRNLYRFYSVPVTFCTGLFTFIGVFMNSPSYLILTSIFIFVAIMLEGAGLCYLLFYFHYVLSVRCLIVFSFIVWFKVGCFFTILSLKSLIVREHNIIHLNYMRESFVIPMRRDILDKLEEIPQHMHREQGTEVA